MQLSVQSMAAQDGGTVAVTIVDSTTGNTGTCILRQEVFGAFLQSLPLLQMFATDILNVANTLGPGDPVVQDVTT